MRWYNNILGWIILGAGVPWFLTEGRFLKCRIMSYRVMETGKGEIQTYF